MKRTMKRIYKGMVSGILSAGLLCTGWTAPIAYAADNISIYVDGKYLRTQVPPYLSPQGYVMLPMRTVYETLGANVRYDSRNKQIIVSKDDKVIKLSIGSETAYVNGSAERLHIAPQIRDGRTMVGFRDGADLLGAEATWDAANRRANIWTSDNRYSDDDVGYSFDEIEEGDWKEAKNQRMSLSINKTGWNTAEIQIYWGGGTSSINGVDYDNGFRDFDGIRWNLTCKWNSDENILEYENGMCFGWFVGDEGFSHSYLLDQDCAGYLYLDSGYLYWVDRKEDVGADCRFVWQG